MGGVAAAELERASSRAATDVPLVDRARPPPAACRRCSSAIFSASSDLTLCSCVAPAVAAGCCWAAGDAADGSSGWNAERWLWLKGRRSKTEAGGRQASGETGEKKFSRNSKGVSGGGAAAAGQGRARGRPAERQA